MSDDPLELAAVEITEIGRVENSAWTTVNRVRATVDRSAEKLGDREFGHTCESLFTRMFDGEGNLWTDLDQVTRTISARCEDCQRAMGLPRQVHDEVAKLRGLYPVVLSQVETVRSLLASSPDDEYMRATARRALDSLPVYKSSGLSPWEDMNGLTGRLGMSLSVVSDCRAGLLAVMERLENVERTRPPALRHAEKAGELIADPRVGPDVRDVLGRHVDAIVSYVRDGTSSNLRAEVHQLLRLLEAGGVVPRMGASAGLPS